MQPSLAFIAAALLALSCGGPQPGESGPRDTGDAGAAAADPIGFRDTAPLSTPRSSHTATRLADGRVLVVGGESIRTRDPLASVEIFDAVTETWTDAAPLPEARSNHQAVLLEDGRVLVIGGGKSAPTGGASGLSVLDSTLLYDPDADAWQSTGSLIEGRSHFGAVLLASGRVLVAGGGSGNHDHGSQCTGAPNCGPLGDTLNSAEIYDPASGAFVPAPAMSAARSLFVMAWVPGVDGVLAATGMNDYRIGFRSTEIYSEEQDVWSAGPDLASEARVFAGAAVLPSGRVLVGGGKLPDTRMLATVDLIDLQSGSASSTARLAVAHTAGQFMSLQSGRVMSAGGFRCPNPCEPIGNVEIYDEMTATWSSLPPLQVGRAGHTLTLLADGRALIVGGYDAWNDTTVCEISISE